MSYGDDAFWAAYKDYVRENRHRHELAIQRLGGLIAPLLDLGCGKVMEGLQLSMGKGPNAYRGVEMFPTTPDGDSGKFEGYFQGQVLAADYRSSLAGIKKWCDESKFQPFMVLSLFSIEATGLPSENAELYHSIFKTFPKVRKIISAGFYYEGQRHHHAVQEANNTISSYQSVGPLLKGDLHEYRLEEHGPSTLFGEEVVEVWRLITRNIRKVDH